MRRFATALSLIALIGFPARTAFAADGAVPAYSANAPVAFGITIGDLHRAAESGDDGAVPADRPLIIDAEIGSVSILADTDDEFAAEVELVGGLWHGEDEVELYRAYAIFEHPRFREFFSRRSATRLLPGDRILVLCRFLGIGVDYDEETPIAVVEAAELRRTQ